MIGKDDVIRTRLGDDGLTLPENLFDQRRTRTAWFEGQHVTAEQFNRDQSYHVTRLADLGRTVGRGVVEGFDVTATEGSVTGLMIAPGLGLANSGEIIHLPTIAEIDIADIPSQRRLNAMLNGSGGPVPPPETRTGLFVLAASTVEYSSNPVGSYPASVTATRTLEDSVINEAVLFTLSPYPVPISQVSSDNWRKSAAYRIFVEASEPDLPPGSLPLAMVALSGNKVIWVDVPMVRRHCAPASGDIFGLGLVDQTRRVAHFEQFDAVIEEVIAGNSGNGIPASELVQALPAMGRLPVASIAPRGIQPEPQRLSQNWLPASVPCELVPLPADEIDSLVRESTHLPPIDLDADDEVLANTPVTIIVPVRREDWSSTPNEVLEAAVPLVAPPAVGGAPTDPASLLDELINGVPVPEPSDTALTAAWRTLLGQADFLWFARRRQFQRSDGAVAGQIVDGPSTGDGGPTPGDNSGGGSGFDVSSDAIFDILNPPLREIHGTMGLESQFERVLIAAPDQVMRFLIRQQQMATDGAHTLLAAMAIRVADMGFDRGGVIEEFPPGTLGAFVELEPAIIGEGLRVSIGQGPDTTPLIRDLISNISSMTPNQSAIALRNFGPLATRADDLQDPAKLKDVLAEATQARAPFSFEMADPFGVETVKARLKLAEAEPLPRLVAMLGRAQREAWPLMIPELRQTFETVTDPSTVVEKLADIAESFV